MPKSFEASILRYVTYLPKKQPDMVRGGDRLTAGARCPKAILCIPQTSPVVITPNFHVYLPHCAPRHKKKNMHPAPQHIRQTVAHRAARHKERIQSVRDRKHRLDEAEMTRTMYVCNAITHATAEVSR